ncbi:hypothetical protein KY284_021020 [Solanum tuberosum]|nr:hypothetical protein KY284_021020 [Solanum tuberosum]
MQFAVLPSSSSVKPANLFLFKEVMQLCLRSLPSMSTSDTQTYDVLVDLEYGDKIVNIDTNTCEDLRQRKGLPTDSINRACTLYDLTCLLRGSVPRGVAEGRGRGGLGERRLEAGAVGGLRAGRLEAAGGVGGGLEATRLEDGVGVGAALGQDASRLGVGGNLGDGRLEASGWVGGRGRAPRGCGWGWGWGWPRGKKPQGRGWGWPRGKTP